MEITGKLVVQVYRQEYSQFTVAKFRLYELVEKDITITGYFPALQKDILYRLFGEYKEHPRYGLQFCVERFERVLPSDEESVVSFLCGPLFPGVGKKLAQAIVDQLGADCLQRIRDNADLLSLVKGMSGKKKTAILEGLSANRDLEDSMRFFTTHGLGIRNIMKLDQIYGKDVLDIVRNNPYQLVEDVDGIGFETADKLAKSMEFDLRSNHRRKAALYSLILEMCMASGDSYVLKEDLEAPLIRKLQDDEIDFSYLLELLMQEKKVVQEQDRIYHSTQYAAENGIAKYFGSFVAKPQLELDDGLLESLLSNIEDAENIRYEQKQKEAIIQFVKHPFLILTGGPGTGKSTIVKAMIMLYKRLYPHQMIALCAPTGRASKRLSELTQTEATTIHRLLKWNLETNTFGMNEESPLMCDLLVVDEFSMVDNWMLFQLLEASKLVSKIVFIGDEDQLPSVACGCVLRDFIASDQFPMVRLEKIFRQKEGSDVVSLAYQLKHQQPIVFSDMNDVKFYDCSPYDVRELVSKIVEAAIDKEYDLSQIQVLAPKYSGNAGIDALNHALQKLCNPPSPFKAELQVGYKLFREGDKILQLKNEPEQDVYNGDIGILEEIVHAQEDEDRRNRIIVNYDGILVEYTADTFYHITHAYCISIHKSQGSEYPIVIMPMVHEYQFMLSKRLIYTGITRAKKSLILLGERSAFEKGILTMDRKERLTTLCHRIEAVFSLHKMAQSSHPNDEE